MYRGAYLNTRMNKCYSYKTKSLKSIFRFFCNNTSMHGCSRITSRKISSFERGFWIALIVSTIAISSYLVQHLWEDYLSNPVMITKDTSRIPVREISFPGIAVCSVNKISKKKADMFAEYLYRNQYQIDSPLQTKADILEAIKMLSDLYDFNLSNKDKQYAFQSYLEKYDNLTTATDPAKRIVELIPNCHEMILRCTWGGIEYDCDEIIRSRMTFDGPCCVFNYIREAKRSKLDKIMNKNTSPLKLLHAYGAGVDKGLQLTLADPLDDYFATTTEIRGFVVHIFNSYDFPDKSSGDLTEVLVNSGTETFISIDVSVVDASSSIRILPAKMRNCIFSDEMETSFGTYRQSDCFALCKLHTMETLCECIPFSQPLDMQKYCTLADLPCLDKFKTKWTNYYPAGEEHTGSLNYEQHESISCPKCLPACKNEVYSISVDVADIKVNRNNTYVNIFFNKPFGESYRIDLQQTWYEMLSSFGGFVSLVMGISFISVVELLMLFHRLGLYACHYLANRYFSNGKKHPKLPFIP